jgi:hypothetical protein
MDNIPIHKVTFHRVCLVWCAVCATVLGSAQQGSSRKITLSIVSPEVDERVPFGTPVYVNLQSLLEQHIPTSSEEMAQQHRQVFRNSSVCLNVIPRSLLHTGNVTIDILQKVGSWSCASFPSEYVLVSLRNSLKWLNMASCSLLLTFHCIFAQQISIARTACRI